MLQPSGVRLVSHSPPPLTLPSVSTPWAAPSGPVLEAVPRNVTGQGSLTSPDGRLVDNSPTTCNSAVPSSVTSSGVADSYHSRCAEAAAGATKATRAASDIASIIIFLIDMLVPSYEYVPPGRSGYAWLGGPFPRGLGYRRGPELFGTRPTAICI